MGSAKGKETPDYKVSSMPSPNVRTFFRRSPHTLSSASFRRPIVCSLKRGTRKPGLLFLYHSGSSGRENFSGKRRRGNGTIADSYVRNSPLQEFRTPRCVRPIRNVREYWSRIALGHHRAKGGSHLFYTRTANRRPIQLR